MRNTTIRTLATSGHTYSQPNLQCSMSPSSLSTKSSKHPLNLVGTVHHGSVPSFSNQCLKPYAVDSVVQLDDTRLLTMEETLLTRRTSLYVLSSILALGVILMLLIPLGSTYLYIDYRQQLVQRKSNKNDLCEKQACEFGAECVIDDYHRQPYCRCPQTCKDELSPVCGSDGVKYDNHCFLQLESCTRQMTISVNNHSCEFNTNRRCGVGQCNRFQKCRNISGIAQCVCDLFNCSKNTPACGSNGKLFGSQCELYQYACIYKSDIQEVALENCSPAAHDHDDDQSGNGAHRQSKCEKCPPYGQCNNGHCDCPDCAGPEADGNVTICGSNKQTYANQCALKRDACLRRDGAIHPLHNGRCGQCSSQCRHWSECKLNENNIPECVCPQVCVRVDLPVCGDNGVTYENECELRIASCRLQEPIAVRLNGSCDLCHDVVCHHGSQCINGRCVCENKCSGPDEPLCANDGNTYRNECEMQRIACNSKRELIAFYHGACESASEVFRSSEPETAGLSDPGSFADYQNPILEPTDSGHSSPLNVAYRLQTNECSRLEEICLQEMTMENADFVYVCDNKTFTNKCKLLEYSCTSSENWNKCSKFCHCNQYGIHAGNYCHDTANRCQCKVGVSGDACDQCDSGYWDFRHSLQSQRSGGCKPCKCNKYGSFSAECQPVTGKCRCKPDVRGSKCDHCPAHHHLTSNGCVPNGRARSSSLPSSSSLSSSSLVDNNNHKHSTKSERKTKFKHHNNLLK